MNIMHQRSLSRRTLLRGVGVSLALPWLEAMEPKLIRASGAAQGEGPRHAVFMFVPNGMYMPDWTPRAEGALTAMPPLLQSLAPHRNDISVISGLANNAAAVSTIRQRHGVSGPSFLTCVAPHETRGSDVRAGVSVDQLIARRLEGRARLASLDLSVETPTGTGACDLNCVYTSSISWRAPNLPVPREISPRAVFERLFGSPTADRSRDIRQQRSVLDFVQAETRALTGTLGRSDRARIDEFLTSVREVETRISASERAAPPDSALTPRGPLPIIPATFSEHTRLMVDLRVLALATDTTRVGSLMLGNEFSNRIFPEIGIRDAHHSISHHASRPESIAKYTAICRYCVTFFGYLLEKMKSVRDADRTLLDRSLVMFGCGMGDGMEHDFRNLPIVLAGRGDGSLRHGRHLQSPSETPLANLYLSLLAQFGIRQERFADSTGPLRGLA